MSKIDIEAVISYNQAKRCTQLVLNLQLSIKETQVLQATKKIQNTKKHADFTENIYKLETIKANT